MGILCQRQPDLQSHKGPRNDFMPTPTRSSKSERAAERFYANANQIFKVRKGRGTILCQRQPDVQSQKGPRNDFMPTPTRSSKLQRAAERFHANANQIFKVTKGRGTILCQRQPDLQSYKGPRNDFMPTPTRSSKLQRAAE